MSSEDSGGSGSGDEEEATREVGSVGVTTLDWEGSLVLPGKDGMF